MQLVARRYDNAEAVRIDCDGPTLRAVTPVSVAATEQLPWVAPGLVDLQVNGYDGQEFSSAELTVERVAAIAARMAEFGVTRFLPTLTTQSAEVFEHALATLAEACRWQPRLARQIAGIHLEGPYLSAEDGPRGAHPAAHCRPPDWAEFQRFQRAAQGRVRLMTLAPELPGAAEFTRQATAAGVVVAIGHTAASGAQIAEVVAAGARLSTHLGNGAHGMLRRHPNYLWDQLAEDRLWASLIVDGQHLPRAVVTTFLRAKTPARCLLVSDLSGLAGLPPGRYTSSGCELEILPDGRLVIAGQQQLLAGASRPLGDCIAQVMAWGGLDLPQAVALATRQPCALMGWPVGELAAGAEADLTLFHLETLGEGESGISRWSPCATILAGEVVAGRLADLEIHPAPVG